LQIYAIVNASKLGDITNVHVVLHTLQSTILSPKCTIL
jgi:hypothetical protein